MYVYIHILTLILLTPDYACQLEIEPITVLAEVTSLPWASQLVGNPRRWGCLQTFGSPGMHGCVRGRLIMGSISS